VWFSTIQCFKISCKSLSLCVLGFRVIFCPVIQSFQLLSSLTESVNKTFRDVMQDNGCHENTVNNNMANSFPQQHPPFKTSLPPPPPLTVKCPPTTFHFLFFVSTLFCLTSRLVILQCNCCENSVPMPTLSKTNKTELSKLSRNSKEKHSDYLR